MSFTIREECSSDVQTDAVADKPRDVIKDQPVDHSSDSLTNDQRPDEQQREQKETFPTYPTNAQKPKVLSSPTKLRKKHGTNTTKTREAKNSFLPQGAGGITVNISQSSGIHVGNTIHINMSSNKAGGQTRKSRSAGFTETKEIKSVKQSMEPVTISDIQLVSSHVGESWKDMGRSLGYSEGQMDQFKADNSGAGLKEVIFQLLLDWKRTNTKDATIGKLSSALWKAEQYDAVDALVEILANNTKKI